MLDKEINLDHNVQNESFRIKEKFHNQSGVKVSFIYLSLSHFLFALKSLCSEISLNWAIFKTTFQNVLQVSKTYKNVSNSLKQSYEQ